MEWYEGTVDIFFGIEHKRRKEEQFNKDVKHGSTQTRHRLLKIMQAVRISGRRRVESSWQLTATWELWLTKKNGPSCLSFGNEGRIAQAWVNVRGGVRVFCRVRLALGRMDPGA